MNGFWKGGPLVAVAGAGMLSACVAVPVGPPPQQLVAVPGANRTQAQFAQDDAACRSLADKPAVTGSQAPAQPFDPAGVYFSCMTSHGDTISAQPAYAAGYPVAAAVPYAAVVSPYLYGAFPYYPYDDAFLLDRGVGYYGPFGFGFGFYGGYGYRYGRGYAFNGYRGGYGSYGGYGGYRGGGYGGGGYRGGYHR